MVPRKSSGKTWSLRFRPLAGCKCFRSSRPASCRSASFRPLAGCGLFRYDCGDCIVDKAFPSPCGVWVVSSASGTGRTATTKSFRPLAGCGLFPIILDESIRLMNEFPSPRGVWVVSLADSINYYIDSVSVPLRGVGCFATAEAQLLSG